MAVELKEETHARSTTLDASSIPAIPYGVPSGDGFAPHTMITLDLTPEAAKALNQLIEQTGDSPTDLFRKAIALYKLTKEAIREGKSVGIAETEDCLETRFVGL